MASGSTSRATLEERLSQAIGDHNEFVTAASNAAATTTDLIDADLADLTESDDGIQGWVEITATTPEAVDGEIRRIKASGGYTASTTTIVVSNAFSADPNAGASTAVTFLVHRINPTLKRNAIQRALEMEYPLLYNAIRDETVIVDNRLANTDFETFSGGFTNWTEVGSPTVTEETSKVFHGSSAAKVVSAGGAVGQLTQAPDVNAPTMAGTTAKFACWAWADAVTNARIRIDWDGAQFENSDYHTGDSSWRLLEVVATIPTDATQVKVICEVVAGGITSYFDLAYLTVGKLVKHTIPAAIVQGPHRVSMQRSALNPADGPYDPIGFDEAPIAGRILRMEGMGYLTRPSSSTATTEIDGARVDLIVARAAEFLYTTIHNQLEGEGNFKALADQWRDERLALELRPGLRMTPLSADIPDANNWSIQEDSSGRYVMFHNVRGVIGETVTL